MGWHGTETAMAMKVRHYQPSGSDGNATPPCLALRPREAAKALGIGERLLWTLTNSGKIPHVRLGRAIVYPVDQLREWLAFQAGPAESSEVDNAQVSG